MLPYVIKQCRLHLLALAILIAPVPGTAEDFPQLRVETSAGDFVVRLDAARAPLSVANFLGYVDRDHYEGTIFHRVVDGFVIQGGGFAPDLEPKPAQPPIANESGNGLSNKRGTIAMARLNEPHTADAQFFINLADNFSLDPKPTRWGYAVFGEVIEGMNVVDDIGHRATTTRNGMSEVPEEPVVIRRISLMDATRQK
jgi:cyclophilin family peptidyl-prolyl cis-trans isomerase